MSTATALDRLEAIRTRVGPPVALTFDPAAGPVANAMRYVAAAHADEVRFLLERVDALTALVIALDPEPDEGSTCWVCRCEDAEYDVPHSATCAYAAARRLVGRGPVEDGGSALVGDPGERAVGDGE